MICDNVINMLPTIFTCALKYKVHTTVLYLGNAFVQCCVLIYNPYVHDLAGYLPQLLC